MPEWLIVAIERWVDEFVICEYTDIEILRKASILIAKIPKLIPNARTLPEWSIKLLRFFFNHKQKKINIKSELFFALIREKNSSIKSINSWIDIFPDIRQIEEESIWFVLEAVKAGYSTSAALAYRGNPVIDGSFAETDTDYDIYKNHLSTDIAEGRLRGNINPTRIDTYIKTMLIKKYKDVVIKLFLEAGPLRKISVKGSISEPIFSIVAK
jgi:hypothetical protein